MSYEVFTTRKAVKQLGRLPQNVAKKAWKTVTGLPDVPRGAQAKKTKGYNRVWHDRVGIHYRIIYVVWDEAQEIEVISAMSREEAGDYSGFTEPELPPSKRKAARKHDSDLVTGSVYHELRRDGSLGLTFRVYCNA